MCGCVWNGMHAQHVRARAFQENEVTQRASFGVFARNAETDGANGDDDATCVSGVVVFCWVPRRIEGTFIVFINSIEL